MTKTKQNDTFYAGNIKVLRFTILDETGLPADLSAYTVRWAMSKYADDGSYSLTPDLKKDNDTLGGVTFVNDGTDGLVDVTIQPEDTDSIVETSRYYHELECVDVLDDPLVAATGTLTIRANLDNA